MGTMVSQITRLPIVYSAVYSGVDQRKHQSSASLAFVRGIQRWPVNSPHKWPVTRKMFPFDDVIMSFQKLGPYRSDFGVISLCMLSAFAFVTVMSHNHGTRSQEAKRCFGMFKCNHYDKFVAGLSHCFGCLFAPHLHASQCCCCDFAGICTAVARVVLCNIVNSSLRKYQSITFIYAIGNTSNQYEQEVYQTNPKESGEIES